MGDTPEVSNDAESFTAAEAAYFSSKGADTAGLDGSASADVGASAGGAAQPAESSASAGAAAAANEGGQAAQAVTDEDGDLVITIDEQGRAKDAKTGRFVPHASLHRERERRKSVEAEFQVTREKYARAEERLAVLNEILAASNEGASAGADGDAAKQQKPKSVFEEEPIDPAQDIFAAFDQQRRMNLELAKMMREGQEKQAQAQKLTEAEKAEQSLIAAYRSDAQRFSAEKPEFKDAYTFLVKQRHAELEAFGITDAAQRNAQIQAEERQLAETALKQKLSPAAVLFKMAQARGFAPAAQVEAAKTQAQAAGADAAQKEAAQKLDAIRRGQQASASLSGAGGRGNEGLTLENLANMSDEEFAAVHSKLGKRAMKKLMQGGA